jgi:hypothetical protein
MPKRRDLEAEMTSLRKLIKKRLLSATAPSSASVTLLKMHVRRLANVEKETEQTRRRADRLL